MRSFNQQITHSSYVTYGTSEWTPQISVQLLKLLVMQFSIYYTVLRPATPISRKWHIPALFACALYPVGD